VLGNVSFDESLFENISWLTLDQMRFSAPAMLRRTTLARGNGHLGCLSGNLTQNISILAHISDRLNGNLLAQSMVSRGIEVLGGCRLDAKAAAPSFLMLVRCLKRAGAADLALPRQSSSPRSWNTRRGLSLLLTLALRRPGTVAVPIYSFNPSSHLHYSYFAPEFSVAL